MNKIKSVLKGVLGSTVLTIICIIVFAFVLASTNLNDNYIKPVLVGITFFSVSFNSFVTLKKIKSKGLIYGLMIGLVYCLILIIVSCVLNSGISFGPYSYIQICICLLSGVLGGILGVNVK